MQQAYENETLQSHESRTGKEKAKAETQSCEVLGRASQTTRCPQVAHQLTAAWVTCGRLLALVGHGPAVTHVREALAPDHSSIEHTMSHAPRFVNRSELYAALISPMCRTEVRPDPTV